MSDTPAAPTTPEQDADFRRFLHPKGEPQTDAGKALVEWAENADPKQVHIWREHALLIEAEARSTPAEALDGLRAALERAGIVDPYQWSLNEATERLRAALSTPATRSQGERAFANPCLYCGTDEYDVPYEDTEEHRNTSEHQITVYNS